MNVDVRVLNLIVNSITNKSLVFSSTNKTKTQDKANEYAMFVLNPIKILVS
jgi:hypothetical protein